MSDLDGDEVEDPRDDPNFEHMQPHEQTVALLGAILDALYDVSGQLEELTDNMKGLSHTLKWN